MPTSLIVLAFCLLVTIIELMILAWDYCCGMAKFDELLRLTWARMQSLSVNIWEVS